MYKSERFYDDLINMCNQDENAMAYINVVRLVDRFGAKAHAKFIQECRYDLGYSLLYYPTELEYEPEGIKESREKGLLPKTDEEKKVWLKKIKQSKREHMQEGTMPIHIEYWKPTNRLEDDDDPIANYITLEQFFDQEILQTFIKAYELAVEKNIVPEFMDCISGDFCLNARVRNLRYWYLNNLSDEPRVYDDPNEMNNFIQLLHDMSIQYSSHYGAAYGHMGKLPENLQTIEPFLLYILDQNVEIYGQSPYDYQDKIISYMEEILGLEMQNPEHNPENQENLSKSANIKADELTGQSLSIAEEMEYDHMLEKIDPGYHAWFNQAFRQYRFEKQKSFEDSLSEALSKVQSFQAQHQAKMAQAPSKDAFNPQSLFQLSLLNKTSDPDLKIIPVMDQVADQSGFGMEACGYHSMKNAFAMIQTLAQKGYTPFDLVKDQGFYNNVMGKLIGYLPSSAESKDVNIPQLKAFYQDVLEGKVFDNDQMFVDVLDSINTLASKQTVPPISIAGFTLGDEFGYASVGPQNLEDLANIYEISKNPNEAMTHTFILGNVNEEGHWFTLTLVQAEDGTKQWLGANSEADSPAEFKQVKQQLEALIANPEPGLYKSYRLAVGDDLANKSKWINPVNMAPRSEEDARILSDQSDLMHDHISKALAFMQRCDWFDPDKMHQYSKELSDVTQLLIYYNRIEPDKWRDLKGKFDTVSQEWMQHFRSTHTDHVTEQIETNTPKPKKPKGAPY